MRADQRNTQKVHAKQLPLMEMVATATGCLFWFDSEHADQKFPPIFCFANHNRDRFIGISINNDVNEF
jgi:hypothetical protein